MCVSAAASLPAASGRLIIDSSKDDGPSEPKKQAGHFPDLCLPGQRSYALQSPWLCTCVAPAGGGGSGGHRGRHRWECVVPESGAGRGTCGRRDARRSRRRPRTRRPHARAQRECSRHPRPPGDVAQVGVGAPPRRGPPASARVGSPRHARVLAEPLLPTRQAPWCTETPQELPGNGRNQSSPALVFSRPSIVIDFCDEFGYVHSVTSSMKECACDKDVIATRLFGFKDSDLYQSSSLFSSYECLPGTYNVRCELCYPDTHNCQPAQCP
ncbi:hypothetical protein ONE63_010818 [Megalurothrips usitatus]|uniref:Uncharacterized protein n=1 Tax=Megalurothrips usitatus TaxID=439358 RepID=A0AAV7XE68_9NEOP|nr:hypothetical protein ONE63_010818 [Megalurothrips usitatus]